MKNRLILGISSFPDYFQNVALKFFVYFLNHLRSSIGRFREFEKSKRKSEASEKQKGKGEQCEVV